MAFKYKIPKKDKLPEPQPIPDFKPEEEVLTGFVQGQDASDIEERFARALAKFKISFDFKFLIFTLSTIGGQRKEIDFRVSSQGELFAVEIDGVIGHTTDAQLGRDRLRDEEIQPVIVKLGWNPNIIRVKEIDLTTQDFADDIVRELFGA